tara:strand:+ start:218 stop:1252 length:1035 start_codon:yes stop_codon:yes gene_type:complete
MIRVFFDKLLNFTEKLFLSVNLDNETAKAVSFGLCETSLRGVDSHGIRLIPHYIESALKGRKNPRPKYKFEQKFPTFGCLDADNTFGHAAGMKSIDIAMPIADKFGLAAIAVKNSSHPGAMATFTLRAARKGYIAFAFTHADSLVCSFNGTRPYFGTNPICFAAPRSNSEPFCLDMAPTSISWNKLLSQKENGETLGINQAADINGEPTQDPNFASSLIPIGGYKGFGLASMAEILCGVMTGMNFGRSIPAMFTSDITKYRKLGQFYLVMRADVCQSQSEFENSLNIMSQDLRKEPAIEGKKVLVPNDPQIIETKIRKENGIPIDSLLEKKLNSIAKKFDIEGI